MQRIATTPFGARPVTAGLLATQARAKAPLESRSLPKWDLFRQLTTARLAFGLTDRDLAVLNALLTFYPGDALEDVPALVVFPSNRTLSARAHGMAESTLRRHLAALIRAGVLRRHDSPNGKRYAARAPGGAIARAFGFDLRPLMERASEIEAAARAAEEAAFHLRRLREEVVLLLRDTTKLLTYAFAEGLIPNIYHDELDKVRKALRRKANSEDLSQWQARLQAIRDKIVSALETIEMDGNDVQTERHYTSSKPENTDIEQSSENRPEAKVPPLPLVLKACPDLEPFGDPPRHWRDLVRTAETVSAMMGIGPDLWCNARDAMGTEAAAVTVSAMLQRVDQIRSPGGYLRVLTSKAEKGKFTPAPMIMALLQ